MLELLAEAAENGHPGLLAMSTQMHSALLADGGGEPVSPLITWQDDRLLESVRGESASLLDEIAHRIPDELRARAGIALRPGYGAGNLMAYLREYEHSGQPVGADLHIHTVGSFVLTSLGLPASTHLTNAAALGLVDLDSCSWSRELVEAYGLTGCTLPAISHDYAPIGQISVAGTTMTVYPDLADHQASIIGAGGLEPSAVALSMGTAGIVARWSPTRSTRTDIDSRPYPGGGYLLTVSRQPGGWIAAAATGFIANVIEGITGRPTRHADVWEAAEHRLGPAPLIHAQPRIRLERGASHENGEVLSVRGLNVAHEQPFHDMMASLVQYFVENYQRSIDILFDGCSDSPQTLYFNGGLAMRGDWFRNQIAAGLSLAVASYPATDLALAGIEELVRAHHSHTSRTPAKELT